MVTHFEPGSKRARLEVGGVKFEYSPSELSPAYTERRAAFGNGSQVRIHYTRRRGIDAILKFELYEGAVCR